MNNFEWVRVEERGVAPVLFAGNVIFIPPKRVAEISSSQPRQPPLQVRLQRAQQSSSD